MKVGRVYNRLLCKACGAEIDTDASVTLELLMDTKPVSLRRDTVTVGFRDREKSDWTSCTVCGAPADLESEDVLETGRNYRCKGCGTEFGLTTEGAMYVIGDNPNGA
jgi:DNA-directed RNA polymerase subunit RPC12/RpoP